MSVATSYRNFRTASNANTTVLSAIGTPTQTEGILHGVNISPDTTGGTVTIRDGGSGGTIVAQFIPGANVPINALLDIQLTVGLFVAVSGFASPAVQVQYR